MYVRVYVHAGIHASMDIYAHAARTDTTNGMAGMAQLLGHDWRMLGTPQTISPTTLAAEGGPCWVR